MARDVEPLLDEPQENGDWHLTLGMTYEKSGPPIHDEELEEQLRSIDEARLIAERESRNYFVR